MLCAQPSLAAGRDAHFIFERFTTAQGLSNAEVNQIHLDRRGYLWAATSYGLNRYDGTGFRVYQHEPDDSLSLTGSWVSRIYEDRTGIFWLIQFTDGLTRFDPVTGTARLVAHDPERPESLSPGRCTAITEDQQGRLWVAAGRDGLCRLDRDRETFEHFREGIAGSEIVDIIDGPDGRLWVATAEAGLRLVDPETGTVTPIPVPAGSAMKGIRLLHRDGAGTMRVVTNDGRLFAAGPDGDGWRLTRAGAPLSDSIAVSGFRESSSRPGLFQVTLRGGRVALYEPGAGRCDVLKLEGPDGHPIPEVAILHEDRGGTLWAGTEIGLFALEDGAAAFQRVPALTRNFAGPLTTPVVTDIREDASGLLWFGTRGLGILKLNPRQKILHHDFLNARLLGEVDAMSVSAVYRDPAGILWIGTIGLGLYRYDRVTQDLAHFHHDPADAATLTHDGVTSVIPAAGGGLWVGTRNGLNLFDTESHRCRRFIHDPANPRTLSGKWIQALAVGPSGDLWVGLTEGGLNRLDPLTGQVERFPMNTSGPEGLTEAQVLALAFDRRGALWISSIPSGLHRFDPPTRRFERFTREADPRLPRSIQTILEDTRGRLWLGSYSDGLVRFDPATGDVRRWSRSSGLPGNLVLSILEDDAGRLWMGTESGLACFDSESGAITVFGTAHGVQNRQFLHASAWKSPEGELFFGGIDGINSFFPDSLKLNTHVPPLVITGFRIDGQPAPVPAAAGAPLRLRPRDRFFSVDFVALDFTEPERNRTMYRLEGLDPDWVDNGTRRTVTYTNLDPGSYTLHLRGSNNDGVWNEAGISLAVIVEPPFWRTRTFLAALSVLAVGSAWGFHRSRLRAARRTALEIERVRQTESERVRRQAARDFHDELGHLVTRISLFGEVLRRRTPAGDVEAGDYLDRLVMTSKRLSQGMGDFIWMLDPGQDSLREVAVRLKDFGDHLYDGAGVTFRAPGVTEVPENVSVPLIWRRHLTLLFKEAMHNALKHSGASSVRLEFLIDNGTVRVILTDDGKGFDVTRPETGRGLHSMRTRAGELGGSLEIASMPGRGTTVTFSGRPAGADGAGSGNGAAAAGASR